MSFMIPPGIDLSGIPLAANPNGSPPNFEHGASLQPLIVGLDVTMVVVSGLFVGVRTWVNCRQLSKIMLDDIFCISGWILFTAYAATCMASASTAKHTWDVSLSAITPTWLIRNAVLGILYPLATWTTKMTIFVLYLRLFGRAKWIKWSCWFGIFFSTILYWTCVILFSIYTFPHKGEHWGLSLAMKIQYDSRVVTVGAVVGSSNLFLDVALLVLPMPIIKGLKMSKAKRLGLAAVFLTGIVGVAGGVLGVYYRVYISNHKNTDPTWYAAAIYVVIAVEIFITLIVSCFPACVSLYKTAVRDTAFVKAIKARLPKTFFTTHGGTTLFGGKNVMSRGTKNETHTDISRQWTKSKPSPIGKEIWCIN